MTPFISFPRGPVAVNANPSTIENNRIYIKYPEQVFSDDTVIFSYYVLEYNTDEINVYYGEAGFEEAQFLCIRSILHITFLLICRGIIYVRHI